MNARDTDKVNPCLLCGWAEHMAVHQFVGEPKPGGLCHRYVPESITRNVHEKPPATASVFSRAAWFLADYAEFWCDCGPHEGAEELRENGERVLEKLELARRLRELDGQWEAKREAGTNADAAEIIASMLQDWKLPGAAYWSPQARRWRVVGAEYHPQADDVLVGIYAPGVDVTLLREDLDAVDPQVAA